jgi:transposase
MPGRSKITTDDEGRSALRALARSARRGEADRARAILMTLAGQRSAEIAAGLGVRASTGRAWRGLFSHGGVAALQHRPPSGRPDRIGAAAAALAEAILAEDARHDRGWTLPRLRAEIRRRGGPAIGNAWLSVQLRRKASAGAGHGTRSRVARTPRPSPPAAADWPS